jgi:hypothetical protein
MAKAKLVTIIFWSSPSSTYLKENTRAVNIGRNLRKKLPRKKTMAKLRRSFLML